jgi:transcriptional regulator with XRE-family HTH domain
VNYKHNNDYCKAFGAHLRKTRLEKGFGMREFALHADVEYSQLSKIERGVSNPTISTVLALAEALGIPHTELFNFKFSIKSRTK